MNAGGGDRFQTHCAEIAKLLLRHKGAGRNDAETRGRGDAGKSHDGYRIELDADRPIPAIKLANWVGVRVGSHDESKRKGVRNVIEQLRLQGWRICADGEGYWIARDDAEWHAYQEARKTQAKFTFARVSQMKKAANEASSQQALLPDESGLAWARA